MKENYQNILTPQQRDKLQKSDCFGYSELQDICGMLINGDLSSEKLSDFLGSLNRHEMAHPAYKPDLSQKIQLGEVAMALWEMACDSTPDARHFSMVLHELEHVRQRLPEIFATLRRCPSRIMFQQLEEYSLLLNVAPFLAHDYAGPDVPGNSPLSFAFLAEPLEYILEAMQQTGWRLDEDEREGTFAELLDARIEAVKLQLETTPCGPLLRWIKSSPNYEKLVTQMNAYSVPFLGWQQDAFIRRQGWSIE